VHPSAAKARYQDGLAEAKRAYEDTLQQLHEAHGEAHLGELRSYGSSRLTRLAAAPCSPLPWVGVY
jgi:hypothetical protein